MEATTPNRLTPSTAQAAIEKYYLLTDNPTALQAILRRMFFEFIRTQPTLSREDIDHLWVVADLVADLEAARPA